MTSQNRFSTMFKFSFRKKKDKKFVSTGTSFRNTYGFFLFVSFLFVSLFCLPSVKKFNLLKTALASSYWIYRKSC